MSLPRSTFYYRPTASETGPTNAEIIAQIEDIRMRRLRAIGLSLAQ